MLLANAMSLGQRLRRERQRLNWSQERLAEAIGTTAMSIHRWEHGQAVPQVRYRERLCQVFNTGADELFAPSTDEDGFAYGHQLIKKVERPVSDSRTLRKITRPALPPTVLHREALLRRLGEVIAGPAPGAAEGVQTYRLVLLSAPAGYGKTTLLVDFAQQSTLPCCWYVLDRSDADTITFLETLLMSIRSRFPQFGAALDPLLAGGRAGDANQRSEGRLESFIAALAEALATEITGRFALVLCNYHEVNGHGEINALVNQLLRLPSECVLVIESRAIPDLEFAPLLAHHEMFVMNHEFFRLSVQEIRELSALQGAIPLNEAEAEQLAAAFDGWMAGILLGTHLGDVRFLQNGAASGAPLLQSSELPLERQHLFAYVVSEVFSRHPEAYAFLKDACVLQVMHPSLCDALLERTDAARRLQYLEQHGLFVSCSGVGSQGTYTCHPVLRELLCDKLRRQSPERFVSLHRRAMEVWQAARDFEQAIYHALEAGLDDMAARLILEAFEQVFAQGRVEMLARWIDALSPGTTARYPRLLLARAHLYLLVGEVALALPLLTAASEVSMQQPPLVATDELPLFQANIALVRSEALFQMGAYEESQQLCQQVIEQVPAEEIALHAEAHTHLGACVNAQGDYHLGTAHLQKALQLWGRDSERPQTAILHNMLGRTYCLTRNFALAEHHLARSAKCWERLHDAWGRVNTLLNCGMARARQGEIAEAEAHLQEALSIARAIHFRRGEGYALINLGELYQEQGYYDRSFVVTEEGLALARQRQDRHLTNRALCTLAMTYLLMGDAETALLLIHEVDLEATSKRSGGYDRAIRELTKGMILLYQRRYGEAYACLAELESYLRSIGLQEELLRTTLRLSECLLRQGRLPEALCRIDERIELLLQRGYEELVRKELSRLPALEQAVRTMPVLALLRTMLKLELESEEQQKEPRLGSSMPTAYLTVTRTTRLTILALGEPAILIDEQPITHWRMARAMELFFFLLDCGRPVRKEQIITALWPEVDERIDHTLHSTIYYLRKALGESCIVFQKGTYSLRLDALYGDQVWYDVAAFQGYFTRASYALTREDAAAAKTILMAMVDLYQGDYLQPLYSDWCNFRRTELRSTYLDARRHLAQLAWHSERFDESARHCQYMLAVDACQEEAQYELMRCYIRQGKRELALRQYHLCKETLQQELGVQPGTTLQNLYQRLMESPSHWVDA